MEGNPLVSVIINCYNGEKYLRETIDSVINQTYKNWEIVFWDNQSTDSSREIVESYKSNKIHYYYAPTHTTLGEARNLAINKANGDYINYLDSDDLWTPDKLEKQVALLDPDVCDVVYTGFKTLYSGKNKKGNQQYRYYEKIKNWRIPQGMSIYQFLLIHNFIIFSSVLFSKLIFKEIGGLNNTFNQNVDYDFLLKCCLRTEIRTTGEAMVIYRIHDSNNSVVNGDCYIAENDEILHSLPESEDVRNAIIRNKIRMSVSLLRKGRPFNSFKLLMENFSLTQILTIIKYR